MSADLIPLFRASSPAEAEALTNQAIDTAVVLGWANAALAAFQKSGDFEGDLEDQVWYLLGALAILCRFKGFDFEDLASSAKAELADLSAQ